MSNSLNVLSICGGGVRGVIPMYTLREIEKQYKIPISKIFDYYSGSSIGSVIIAALLVSDDGINPKFTCDELYVKIEELCKKIFYTSWYYWWKTMDGAFGSKYKSENLEKLLLDFFGDKKMKDLLKPVCFPCYATHEVKKTVNNKEEILVVEDPIYFTRENHSELLIRDVLRGTTAAPTIFDPKVMIIDDVTYTLASTNDSKSYKLYDSGVAVNNPSLIAILKATNNLQIIDKSQIHELCLGTGIGMAPQPTDYGIWGWSSNIIGYIMNGYNKNEMYALSLFLSKENYYFVNMDIEYKYNSIDDASDKSLEYLRKVINDWMVNNKTSFYDFVDKLIAKKFDFNQNSVII